MLAGVSGTVTMIIPRKVGSQQLCQKVSISKPTLLQHMRKAEGRILKEIMTGYFQRPE